MTDNLYYVIAVVSVIFLCIIILASWQRRKKKNNQQEEARVKSAKIRQEHPTKSTLNIHHKMVEVEINPEYSLYQIRSPSSNALKICSTNSRSSNVNKSNVSMSGLHAKSEPTLTEQEDSLNELDGKYRKETESHTASKLDHGDDDYYLVTMIEQNYAQSALREDLEVVAPSGTRES